MTYNSGIQAYDVFMELQKAREDGRRFGYRLLSNWEDYRRVQRLKLKYVNGLLFAILNDSPYYINKYEIAPEKDVKRAFLLGVLDIWLYPPPPSTLYR